MAVSNNTIFTYFLFFYTVLDNRQHNTDIIYFFVLTNYNMLGIFMFIILFIFGFTASTLAVIPYFVIL